MDIKQEIPFQIPTEKIIIGRSLFADLCNYTGNYRSCLVVCDDNTKDFVNIDEKQAHKLVLKGNVKPSLEEAQKIPHGYDIYVAAGSGTINDLVKYASHHAGKPYVVFATAASMNGYASGNASLIENGHKRSFAAHPPKAIFMDMDIIESAPRKLTLAGIGDALCRELTENDNLLANHLRGDEYFHALFRLMEKYEDSITHNIEALCKTLIFGGVAMYVAQSSVPASGAEHMLAHYMELMQPDAPHSLHGEQVAICTVAMARIQSEIIHSNKLTLRNQDNELIKTHFANSGEADYFVKETTEKYSSITEAHLAFPHSLFSTPNADDMEERFKAIGLPTKPEDIGWNRDIFEHALQYAAFTRNRITFLDLENKIT